MKSSGLSAMALVGLLGCSSSASDSGHRSSGENSNSSPVPAAPTGGSGDKASTPGGGGVASGAPSESVGGTTSGSGATTGGGGFFGSGSGSGGSAGPASGTAGGASASSASGVSAGSDEGGVSQVSPGILTAGLWDDSLNYDFFGKYLASHPSIPGDPGFVQSDYAASHAMFAQLQPHSVVDAALVIDTTGSMADELSYLTAEFANIWNAISQAIPNATQRWALILYRDRPDTDPGDEYVVRTFDFVDNAQTFAATISKQTAANGGDYPEAPELGLEQLKQLTWQTGSSVAKVAFWVGDAPHHEQHAADMKQAISDTLAGGIHLYPVSASGADDLLEFTMRSAAELTGGRYLFLTDDSGVGDPHKIPEIPCYFVTKLAKALVRAVAMEVSGTHIGPDPADVIRTVGNPTSDGKCTTLDGQTVKIF